MINNDISMGLVRVTEAAALGAAKLMGRGERIAATKAAAEGMNKAFGMMSIKGKIVIGEKKKDEYSVLYVDQIIGEKIKDMIEMDIAVVPLDGDSLIAKGLPNAISAAVIGPKGSLLPVPDMYMKKIAVGAEAKGIIDINKSPKENMFRVAKALKKDITELTIIVQERKRHDFIVKQAREVGVRVKHFQEGDIAAVLACGFENTGIDLFMGIGGAKEGVIAAAAIKCMGGEMQTKLLPENDEQKEQCTLMGVKNFDKVFSDEDLVKSENVYFAASGVTECDLLKGVVYSKHDWAKTHSVVMRAKTGTIRFVEASHNLNKSSLL